MNAIQLLTGSIAQAIGWALLHLLWQATIVAGILAAVLALLPRSSATARYAASCGALALVFGLFVATAFRAYDPAAARIVTTSDAHAGETLSVPLSKIPIVIVATATEGWRDRAMDAVTSARQSLPSVVAIWFVGVVFLSSRLLISFMRVRIMATRGVREASAEWQRVAARLSESLGLRRAVRLLESAAVEVPSVLGSLRPIILLPASTLTGLTPEQIEMVLAHELAHIRRHDFAINLLQAFVETLMFYHPAVWWMSSRVRIERENCCDDLAVAVCGNPIQYARALTRLEELRAGAMPMVVAANGGSLLDRIRRIAGDRAESTGLSSRWAAAVAMLSILAIALAIPSVPALAQREEKTEAPKAAKSTVDVVESAAMDDSDVDRDLEPEVDVDSDVHVDGDVDPDLEIDPIADLDTDVDLGDLDDIHPVIAPMPPNPPVAMYAPRAPMVTLAPMVAPTPMPAPTPMVAPTAPLPPRTPHPTPRARIAALDKMNFELDYEHETGGDENDSDRKISASGKLTVDELISLRAVGVTPAYINTMRGLFPDLTVRQVSSLRAVGVTPEYIREMRAAGVEIKTARDASSLRAVGVTPKFVKKLADAGYKNLSARELSRLAAAGIDDDFIREMEQYRDKN